MEGDNVPHAVFQPVFYFNPLPPHGGRPRLPRLCILCTRISIHSLRMEGDFKLAVDRLAGFLISIHSLRMEGDATFWRRQELLKPFQSTPSAWRETIVTC